MLSDTLAEAVQGIDYYTEQVPNIYGGRNAERVAKLRAELVSFVISLDGGAAFAVRGMPLTEPQQAEAEAFFANLKEATGGGPAFKLGLGAQPATANPDVASGRNPNRGPSEGFNGLAQLFHKFQHGGKEYTFIGWGAKFVTCEADGRRYRLPRDLFKVEYGKLKEVNAA